MNRYWEDPEKFDPDRFNKDRRSSIVPYTYLPFGSGPRNCIGMRFAVLESKVALFNLLRDFELEPCGRTHKDLKFDRTNIISSVEGGNYIKLVPRTK